MFRILAGPKFALGILQIFGMKNNSLKFAVAAISACIFISCSQGQKTESSAAQEQTTQTSNELVAVGSGAKPANQPIVVASDSLIVPGRSAGEIELETNAAPVMQKLGKPDAGDAAMGKSVSTWFEQHDTSGHALSIFTAKDMGNSSTALIKQIRVTAPSYKTEHGISTAATLTEIEKAFSLKKMKGYQLKAEPVEVYADPAGIAFEIDKRGRCIGIVIYPKGDLHADTYARFLPEARSLK